MIANWKMYLQSPEEAKRYVATLKRRIKAAPAAEAWLAPSFTLLPAVAGACKGSRIKVGGQSVSAHEGGAHTGEVSAAMLKSAGAGFSLVGHSERRAMGEGDEVVHAQLMAALQSGLVAVLCVGEEERRDDGWHFVHIEAQLRTALVGVHPFIDKIVIAYEPVWAIGKSAADAMTPENVEEMVIFLRKTLTEIVGRTAAHKVPILYGGSVEGENARVLLASGVNGFLVGHASATVDSFIEILKACKK